ncbi:hypothetical protein KAFR_0F01150 [Kazachstania africana CBS 2517]|uniref:non-specific serine/threonine protein kinase n=1 Tax=Kazachstania africana (strain ATCC 22294 / BCRC 22015 / CBS 2517 / CECT 1963 / NBRC 1671 / NRRL Y-8276) TaxID=1071382 RepID=H2AWG1_KAZAF|nr:hypothetical protein KAFR_0F01150 [Kazachstania africana CBS 2517]CCF58711.1 hypothetical protein KAFR_0F01150 [Kazachstania africana CBS 2517]
MLNPCIKLMKECFTFCSSCFPYYSETLITVNARKYQVVRLLGEKSLSFTYLVERTSPTSDASNDATRLFAMKVISCPFGDIDTISNALQEIELYKYFHSAHIINLYGSQVSQELDGSRTILILLPYYPLGSLQDMIDRNLLDGSTVSESQCIKIMVSLCKGLDILHNSSSRAVGNMKASFDSVSITVSDDAASLLADTPLELAVMSPTNYTEESFALLNMSPTTVLFRSDGTPLIGDLSICSKVKFEITESADLLAFKERIQENCSLPYLAPELVSLKKGSLITKEVDIWSLGAILYFLMYGVSPFEREEQLNGTPIKYAIKKGQYSFPQESEYSSSLNDIIISCLQVDPSMRSSPIQLINALEDL